MPYKDNSSLPAAVKSHLPVHAQDIYRKAFNHAYKEYKDPKLRKDDSSREEIAHKVAWSAVKNKYIKDKDSGNWVLK
jgi:cation transport regulator